MALSTTLAALTLALLALGAQAQYGNVESAGGAFDRGTVGNGGSRLTLSEVELAELKGVWRYVGSQQPESAYIATENDTLPDCASEDGEYSYGGLDTTADQYLVLAGTNGVNRMVVNLQRSTFSPNVTYNGSLILALQRGMTTCTHFAPFVDLATGELMAESIAMTQWTTNSTTGGATRTNMNCQVTGTELPGCYTGEVGQSSGGASAPSVAISSIALPPSPPRAPGSVVTVTRTTYQCGNGECIRLAPKYAGTSPVYGG